MGGLSGGGMFDRLEECFSEEEIRSAISGLNSDKAPGPDGFPIAFWIFG